MRRASRQHDPRATFLPVLLGSLVAGGIMFFLFLICGGFSLYVAGVLVGITALGLVHYVLWGHSLSEAVAGEREEQERETLLEEDGD